MKKLFLFIGLFLMLSLSANSVKPDADNLLIFTKGLFKKEALQDVPKAINNDVVICWLFKDNISSVHKFDVEGDLINKSTIILTDDSESDKDFYVFRITNVENLYLFLDLQNNLITLSSKTNGVYHTLDIYPIKTFTVF